jgi:hypothetical protein
MVYFGPRKYRPDREGMSLREKMRVIGPLLLLLALAMILLFPQLPVEQPGPSAVDVTPLRGGPVPDPDGGSSIGSSGSNVPEPVSISPVVELPPMAAPFVEDPSRLAAVRDIEARIPGQAELDGQIYLLHRWRSGHAVEDAGEAPRVPEIAEDAASLRGKRHLLVLTLIEHPQPRTLEENASGLTRYWEVFGSDLDGRLHRVDFIEKPKNLPSGSDVLMSGDFLRLYRYMTARGGEGMVPQWVAQTLTSYQSPFEQKGDPYLPLWIILTISMSTLILLLMIQNRSRGGTRRVSRGRRAR